MQTLTKLIKPKTPHLSSRRHLSTLPPPPRSPLPATATTTATTTAIASTTDIYDELMQEAAQSRNFNCIKFLLTRRMNFGKFNTKTFRFITKSQPSLEMLHELFETLATLPDVTTRKHACNLLVRRLCKIDLVDNALHMIDEMLKRDLEVDAFTFCPVIEAFIKNNELEKAMRFLYEMEGFGVLLDADLYELVLREYCVNGDVGNASEWLEKMVREEALKGDRETYNSMVRCACEAGKVEGAIAIIRAAIDDKDVRSNHYMYEYVIRSLLEDELYEYAVKFVMICAGRFEKLDKKLFDFLAVGLMMNKRFEDAKMVVNEMCKRGLSMSPRVKKLLDEMNASKTCL